jgi:glycosyltransferase involved in cell wall biosynthesis
VVPFRRVRVVVDYRPALRHRTGLGEYVHELARALTALPGAPVHVTAFSASWRDRVTAEAAADLPGVQVVDRAVPVGLLRRAWARAAWPPVESLAGPHDVAHSPTPLLLPSRRGAQVVTVFDLHFLHAPDEARDVAQRDFARRVRADVRRADHVIAGSGYAAGLVRDDLGVAPERVTTTPLGAPRWAADVRRQRGSAPGRHFLFVGTLEPRKNVGLLLDAYETLCRRRTDVPPLVLAGGLAPGGQAWVDRAGRGALAGRVQVTGYVTDAERRRLFAEARALVLPSVDEGFGLPVLEALACGVPVVASPAGALPDLVAEAGLVAPLGAPGAWADALERCLDDTVAADLAVRGPRRAEAFTWAATAEATRLAYERACAARRERR